MKVEVLAKNEVIGHSDMQHGDPPMGVVMGKFVPNENYLKYQNLVREYQLYNGTYGHQDMDKLQVLQGKVDALDLQARTPHGEMLQPSGGIHITDLSVELDEEEMEVAILGLSHETYKKYFQSFIDEYENQFR